MHSWILITILPGSKNMGHSYVENIIMNQTSIDFRFPNHIRKRNKQILSKNGSGGSDIFEAFFALRITVPVLDI